MVETPGRTVGTGVQSLVDRSNERDPFWLPLIILLLVDAGTLFGSVMLAYLIRFSPWFTSLLPHTPGLPVFREYLALGVYATVFGLFVFQRFGLYARRVGVERKAHALHIVSAVVVTYVFLAAWLFVYVNWQYDYSRWLVFLSLMLTAGGGTGIHFLLGEIQGHMIRRGVGFERTLVVAAGQDLGEVSRRLRAWHGSRHHVVGYLVPADGNRGAPPDAPILGTLDQIERVLGDGGVDVVVIALPPGSCREAVSLLGRCRKKGVEVRMVPALFEAVAYRIGVGENRWIPTISLGETPLTGSYAAFKALLDMVVAGTLLVLSLPLMAAISVSIKLDSRGPVLYRQERVGAGGRLFTLYKFRTMRWGAESATGPVFARDNDPRCTRVGRYLRRYNLDEIPQLVNVLRGEMAVVGPRPERPYFVNRFKAEIPGYMRRHVVKPGMTGWAQVHGLRGNTSVTDRTRYDIYYIENWSLFLDFRILLRTLVSNRNAY